MNVCVELMELFPATVVCEGEIERIITAEEREWFRDDCLLNLSLRKSECLATVAQYEACIVAVVSTACTGETGTPDECLEVEPCW